MTERESRLRAFLGANFLLPGDQSLGADDSLMDLGVMDSTGVLELADFLEQDFAIDVGDHEMTRANLDSIRAILGFVARKKGEA